MKCVNIEDIAKVYGDLLGHNYCADVNSNFNFTGKKIQVCIYPTRTPYKVRNINSEVIQIAIEIYMPVTYTAQRDAILNHINKSINGLQEGEFESNGDTWSYCSTLDFTRPLMAPMVDSGQFMQLVSLQGQILVSASDGAMLLNDIKHELTIDEVDENGVITTTYGELKVLEDDTSSQNEPEATLMCNEAFASAYNKTQSSSMSINILLMNDNLCKRLVKAIERIEPFDKNQIFKLDTTYKKWDLKSSQEYILTSAVRSGRAGAFSVISLTFMHASSIIGEEDE